MISHTQDSYKCLSIAQPWAWSICYAGKRIENRTQSTTHRGTMLIQASKSGEWMQSGMDTLHGLKACRELRRDGTGDEMNLPGPGELDTGVVIGVCRVVDCVTPTDAMARWPHQRVWINTAWKNTCWVLEEVCPFVRPVRLLGKLGLFDVEPHEEMREQIRAAVAAARDRREEPMAGAGLFPRAAGRVI